MNSKKITFNSFPIFAAVAFALVLEPAAQAGSGTWNGSTDANWNTPGNWTTATPGATTGTTNTDTATFNAAAPAFGTGANPVIIDAGRNLQNLTFDTNAGAYVIGTTGGNALNLTSGGTTQIAATATSGNIETLNAPLVLNGTAGVGTYTFANNSANLTSGLQIGGTVTGAANTAVTLTLGGGNSSANNILSGTLSAGSGTGSLAINASGTGSWDVTGNNSGYAGTTTISAGKLSIGNSNALGSGTIALTGGTLAADTDVTLTNNFVNSVSGKIGFVSGSHNITTSGNYTFTSTTGTPSTFYNNMTNGATFSVTGTTTLANNTSNIGQIYFGGAGNTSLDTIWGGPSGNTTINSNLGYYGTGTLTLNGLNFAGGSENFLGGTVVANENGDGQGFLLGAGSNLLVLGGNLVLSGGGGVTENVGSFGVAGSAQLSYQANISAAAGSGNTINLGTLGGAAVSTINFQPGVAFTTTGSGVAATPGLGNTGIYGGWATAGNGLNSEDFAANLSASGSSNAIVALPTYLYSPVGRNTAFSMLIGNASGTAGSDTGDGNFLNVKIDTSNGTASGSYYFGRTNAFYNTDGAAEALLFTGFGNFLTGGNAMVQATSTSSLVTGTIYLEQYGTGTLTISNNLYGTGVFASAGAAGSIGSNPLNGNIASVSGASTGQLIKSGPGTVVLTGTNNYVGNTYINGGVLSISSDSNLGGISGTVTVATATTNSTTVTVTGLPVSQTLVGASFLGTTITNQSTSVGGVVTLTLAAAKSAAAGVTSYANGQQLIELNGGTLQATSSFTLGETNGTVSNYRPITIGVNGGTIDVTGTNTLVAPGVISQTTGGTGQLGGDNGVATLTKTDSGTLVLAGANTYLGGTIVNGGTLKLDFGATGISNFTAPTSNILASGGAVTLGGGTLSINGAATAIANTQTIASLGLSSANSTITLTPNSATSVGLVVTNGSITRAAGSTIDFNPGTNTSVTLTGNNSNPLLGNYAFYGTGTTEGYAATSSTGVVQAAATTAATGANNFTSATGNYAYTSPGATDTLTGNATANTVIFNTAGTQVIDLGASGANTLTLNGFLNNGGALTIKRTGGTGTVAIGSSNELVIGGASNVAITAPISGVGGLTDANSGTLTLSGVNTYTGVTTVNSGTLALTGSLNGSNIATAGSGVFSQASTATITGSGTTFTQGSTGTSTLSGANTYTGLTSVTNGELDVTNVSGPAVSGNVAVSGGILKLASSNAIASTGSLAVSGGTANIQTFNQTLAGVQLTGGTLTGTTGVLTSNSTIDLQAGLESAIMGGTNGLTKSSTGVVLMTSANTYTGTTAINGGTLYFSNIAGLGASTSAVLLNGGTLYYSGTAGTLNRGLTMSVNSELDSSSAGTGLTLTGNITGNGLTTTFGGTGNMNIAGNVATTSGSVINDSFGIVTLSGTNSYTGSTTLNTGTLNVGSLGALAGGGSIVFNGGTLQYSAGNQIDYVSRFSSTSIGAISIDTNGQNVTFNTALTTSNTLDGLTKLGSGTLTVSGANTYTGFTNINAGALAVSNINVVGGSSSLGNATTAIFLNGGTLLYTGTTTTATRAIQTSADNSEIDTTTAGQTLTIGSLTGSNRDVIGGAGNTTLTSAIAINTLTKIGSGTLTLTGTNTYTGATNIDSGVVQVGNGTTGSLSSTAPIAFLGGTLNLNEAAGATQTLGALTASAGDGVVKSTYGGSGTTTTTFASLAARTAGATINFTTSGGTSANNVINLTTGTAGQILGDGFFFNGSSYAVVNSAAGPIRGMIYTGTPDTGAAQNTGGTTAATTAHLQVTGNLTAQATGTFTDINLSNQGTAPNITLASAATVRVDGLLKTGTGTSTISGGTGITSVNTGDEFVIRADQATDVLNISSSILANGTNALTKSGAGTLTLSGANTYLGVTTIDGGTLSVANIVGAGSNIGSATSAVVLNTGTLSYTGNTATYTRGLSVTAGGGEFDTTTSGQTLTIGTGGIAMTNQGITTFGGAGNTTVTSVISGNGSLVKTGTGTVTLSGVNTYTQATSINGGTLAINGNSPAALGQISVGGFAGGASTATLSGTGTITAPISTFSTNGNVGHIAPGTNTAGSNFGTTGGTLTVAGAMNIGTGTALDFDLSSSTSTGNDLIAMTGGGPAGVLTIGSTLTINLNALGTLATGSTTSGFYTLISGAASTAGSFGSTVYTVNLAGSSDLAHVFTSGNNLDVYFTAGVVNGQYTLTTTAASLNVHANGGTTTLATTIANTGTGTQDTLDYTGVTATAGSGGVGAATGNTSGSNLAQGANNSPGASQTYTAGATAGNVTVGNSATVTNHNGATGTPTGTSVGTTINVFSGLSTWSVNGGGSWSTAGTGAFGAGANWGANQGAPGVTAGFSNTDTATFDNSVLTAGNSPTVTLDGANPSLKAITFNTQAGSGYTIAQGTGGALALAGNGGNATVTVTSGNHTISAPVGLTTSADVNVAAAQSITFSGTMSGTGGLNNIGGGATILSGANTYGGGTTISAGTVYANNASGSGTGTGAVTVNSGGTLAGGGTVKPTGGAGVTINSGATLASGSKQTAFATVNGGNGAVNGTGTGGGLTLDNTEASSSLLTINGGAKLTFALGSTTAFNGGSGSLNFANPNTDSTFLNITGNTADQIFSNTTLAINIALVDLTNGSNGVSLTLRSQNPYLLIQTALSNNADFANLVTTGGTGANGYVLGVSNGSGGYTAFNLGAYDINGNLVNSGSNLENLQLYLYNGDLEVVPEPGTWALMLGGLALLFVIQRRRNKV